MNGKYKIIALDLDGTLTDENKHISQANRNALISIQKAGITVVLASGRPTHGIVPQAKELQLDTYGGYILSYNGGKITSCRDGHILARHTLDLDLIPHIYHIANEMGLPIVTFTRDAILTETPDHPDVIMEGKINNDMEIIGVDDLVSAVKRPPFKFTVFGDKDQLKLLKNKYRNEMGGQVNVLSSSSGVLDICPVNVDKGNSMAFLLKDQGLQPEELIAVGDSYNDLGMIQLAGLGVAMANATEAVKQCANYITMSNDESGIEHLINKYIMHRDEREPVDLESFNALTRNTLMSTLGIRCTMLEAGHVEATMPVDVRTRQPFGILHGGATLALAETLAGYGSMYLLEEDEIQVGMQVSGNHISSAHEGEMVKGVATILHKGRSSHVWNIDVVNDKGKIISSIRVINSILKRR